MYTAIVLHPAESSKLLLHFNDIIPSNWKKCAHHMTINLGNSVIGPAHHLIGKEAIITVYTLAQDEKVIAVGVDATTEDGYEVPSQNKIKHITLAINTAIGGKPVHSNNLKNWIPVEQLKLTGIIQEVQ